MNARAVTNTGVAAVTATRVTAAMASDHEEIATATGVAMASVVRLATRMSLGVANYDFVEVVKGLNTGDVVSLVAPPANTGAKPVAVTK